MGDGLDETQDWGLRHVTDDLEKRLKGMLFELVDRVNRTPPKSGLYEHKGSMSRNSTYKVNVK
jgi:hypothetical protein